MNKSQQDLVDRAETMDGIDRGLASIEQGLGIDAEAFFAWME